MPDRCALCGDEPVWSTATIPAAWETLLRTEHGLEETETFYLLPTCESCAEDFSLQRELDPSADDPELEPEESTRELLAEIDLDALISERETEAFESDT